MLFAAGISLKNKLPLLLCVGCFLFSFKTVAQLSQPVEKQDIEAATLLFEEAKAHYNIREYEKALSNFKQAYILSREPVLILNIGQCYRYLGQYEEAVSSYQTFLLEDPKTPYREKVENLIKEMESLLPTEEILQEIVEEKEKNSNEQETIKPTLIEGTITPEILHEDETFPVDELSQEEIPENETQTSSPEESSSQPAKTQAKNPKLLIGVTAAAFTLGAGSGGLAIALAMRSRRFNQNDEIPASEEAFVNANRFAAAAGGLLLTSVLSGTLSYLLYRRAKKLGKTESNKVFQFTPMLIIKP